MALSTSSIPSSLIPVRPQQGYFTFVRFQPYTGGTARRSSPRSRGGSRRISTPEEVRHRHEQQRADHEPQVEGRADESQHASPALRRRHVRDVRLRRGDVAAAHAREQPGAEQDDEARRRAGNCADLRREAEQYPRDAGPPRESMMTGWRPRSSEIRPSSGAAVNCAGEYDAASNPMKTSLTPKERT